jgi:hypothetical protein
MSSCPAVRLGEPGNPGGILDNYLSVWDAFTKAVQSRVSLNEPSLPLGMRPIYFVYQMGKRLAGT